MQQAALVEPQLGKDVEIKEPLTKAEEEERDRRFRGGAFEDSEQPVAEAGSAQAVFNEAQRDLRDGKTDEALKKFMFLLGYDRDHPQILFNCGACLLKRGDNALAFHIFKRCLDIKPDFCEALNNIGWIHEHENEHTEAEAAFRKAIEIDPKKTEFWNNLATVYVNNGTPDKAMEYADESIARGEDNVDAKWNKSLALLEAGNFEEGFKWYEFGKEGDLAKRKKRTFWPDKDGRTPEWKGPADEAKTVAVYGEQGVGDEIMFASLIPEIQRDVETVILDCHPRLHNIYRHAFPGVTVYGTRKENQIQWPSRHKIDACVAIGSLAQHYRKTREDFPRVPYLKPFEDRVAAWYEQWASRGLDDKPRIGFSWRGGTKLTRKDLRSIMLDQWRPLFESIDAHWVSLQYEHKEMMGLAKTQLDVFENECKEWAPPIIRIPEADDLDECYGAVIHTLDLVISINTSLVHACGAYGVPCWVLTPCRPAWRYGVEGEDMVWYDSIKQYRQDYQKDDWGPVLKRVAKDLQAKFPISSAGRRKK